MKDRIARIIAWALQQRLVRTFLVYSEHRGSMLADSITYRALFSVFAAVLLGFSMAALWLGGNPEAISSLTASLDRVVPGLTGVIDPRTIEAPAAFTVVGIASLVGLVGAAISAIGSLRTALRLLADEFSDDVAFYWVLLRNLALAATLGTLLVAASVASVASSSALGSIAAWAGLDADSAIFNWLGRAIGILIVFAIDTLAVVIGFRLLSGVAARSRDLWVGGMLGGAGLVILQEFSGLFVRGATSNPLLASFAALIALLLWFNLSAQVLLLASTYIIVATAERHDRVRQVYGAPTLAEWKRLRAEDRLAAERRALEAAQRSIVNVADKEG